MKHASEAEDLSEAQEPEGRGWFQPLSRSAAADVPGSPTGNVSTQAGTDGSRADSGSTRTDLTRPQTTFDPLRSEATFDAFRPAVRRPAPDAETAAVELSHPQAPDDDSAAGAGEPPAEAGGPEAGVDDTRVDIVPRPAPFDVYRRVMPAVVPVEAGNSAPAAESSPPPAEKPASKKPSRSVFGPEPASRPDMLTDAETVVMASLKGTKGSATGPSAVSAGKQGVTGRKAAAAKKPPITTMVPVGTSAEFAEAVTQVLPAMAPHPVAAEPGSILSRGKFRAKQRKREDFEPPQRYIPKRRTTAISRLVLLAILCLQAVLSLRLHNTAFEDEALYLYSGHMELEHLLHGSALYGGFASYFSGAPVLYPVLAAALNQLDGLAAVRALSLAEMLVTTALLYSLTRRLFNERIGLCAAALFSVTESAIFLGNFATYDATCLFLLACATWITVRTAAFGRPVFLLAALPAALAVAVKYAGLLFVPTIAVLPALVGWPERGRRVLWYPFGFALVIAGLLVAALRLGGPAYLSAIQSTTTNRAQGAVPYYTIAREAAQWGGVVFAVAVIGAVTYAWRVRTEPDEKIAPAGGRLCRIALGATLTGSALLAPAYQAYLHTDISFLKHIGFGLFFAAPMAGFGLARIMGDYFRRPQFGIGIWSLALVLGIMQSSYLYHVWPSSGPFVSAFSRYLKPNALYLVEVPEVPMYYLEGRQDAQPKQFISTYSIPPLTTAADFAKVVKAGEFQVIAYTGVVTPGNDQALARALAASHSYYLAAKISASDSSGPVDYYLWVKGHTSSPGSKTRKAKKA